MESVIVKASKTVKAGNAQITYDYEATIPIGDLVDNCLSPHILDHLTTFMQNLISEGEENE